MFHLATQDRHQQNHTSLIRKDSILTGKREERQKHTEKENRGEKWGTDKWRICVGVGERGWGEGGKVLEE